MNLRVAVPPLIWDKTYVYTYIHFIDWKFIMSHSPSPYSTYSE